MKRFAVLVGVAAIVGTFNLVLLVTLVGVVGAGPTASGNGDCNGDGSINLADVVYLLAHIFEGGPEPVAIAGSGVPQYTQTSTTTFVGSSSGPIPINPNQLYRVVVTCNETASPQGFAPAIRFNGVSGFDSYTWFSVDTFGGGLFPQTIEDTSSFGPDTTYIPLAAAGGPSRHFQAEFTVNTHAAGPGGSDDGAFVNGSSFTTVDQSSAMGGGPLLTDRRFSGSWIDGPLPLVVDSMEVLDINGVSQPSARVSVYVLAH